MKVLRWREVEERIGVSRSTLWRWVRDGRFPPGVRLGPNAVGWVETEVDAWLESRPVVGVGTGGDDDEADADES